MQTFSITDSAEDRPFVLIEAADFAQAIERARQIRAMLDRPAEPGVVDSWTVAIHEGPRHAPYFTDSYFRIREMTRPASEPLH